ncbi:zf-HC2 domain-containing protein [Streptomyces sp. NPDC050560]|uniref:zf-HC2 domain-containing protein n=1 Tax=Streptomyces sp. NPDC050560 TaxID=3365630 RepID=UPI0037BDD198
MSTDEQRGTPGPGGAAAPGSVHETVGAYALGILDDAEATAFEEHLADCDRCARDLDDLVGVTPMLAALAGLPDAPGQDTAPGAARGTASAAPGTAAPAPPSTPRATPEPKSAAASVPAVPYEPEPGPGLSEKLFGQVAARRARRRRRTMALVAASAALIIGGPTAVVAITDGRRGAAHTAMPSEHAQLRAMPQTLRATDSATKVSATLGLDRKAWGTHAMLELTNVHGPLRCTLVAYAKDGARETLASWAVPKWGYGIANSTYASAKYPLYVHGGASLPPNDIDHFEVRTFDGKRLVSLHS